MAHDTVLTTRTPEALGIPSACITRLVRRIKERKLREHSLLILRHGEICAEGYAPGFGEAQLHRMYSSSKTFVTAAVGRLILEGRLSLSDRIISFFPDKLPKKVLPEVAEMTVQHLLMMATPYDCTTYSFDPAVKDWAATFFHATPSHIPGTVFKYDTSGTYILDVIVERITGMPILEYLKQTVFKNAGFSADAWCVKAPEGNSWCGSGVLCTSRDLAKLALLFMNGGRWGEEQVLPEDFVRQATSRMIDNSTRGRAENCWEGYGYGFFIWRLWRNAYAMLGMGDQMAVCIPEKDLLVVTTADNQSSACSQTVLLEAVWDCLVDNASENALPEDPAALAELCAELDDLSLPIIDGTAHSPFERELQDRVYEATRPNDMGITRFSFHFDGDEGEFRYTNARGEKAIRFGLGHYTDGVFPEEYSGETINRPAGRGYRTTACAVFTEPQKLVFRCDIVDWYLGNLTATFGFRDDVCGFRMVKNGEAFLLDYTGWGEGRRKDGKS